MNENEEIFLRNQPDVEKNPQFGAEFQRVLPESAT